MWSCLGTSREQLQRVAGSVRWKTFKRRRLILTPYDGRYAKQSVSESVQTRLYELELAKKYDFITIADWYQVAVKIQTFGWVDFVHFNMETNGGELYAQTVKSPY